MKIFFKKMNIVKLRSQISGKSIVQDYKHLRDMVQTIPNYGNINNKKLATFISNN